MNAVATAEETTREDRTPRQWSRTPEQQQTVDRYLSMIAEMYAGADPGLRAALEDPEILGTDELATFLRYLRRTRVFQLYTELRTLAEADQVPHPSAMPDFDATGGQRGGRPIRGVMKGRIVQWVLQSGRIYWNPILGQIVPQEAINHGGPAKLT